MNTYQLANYYGSMLVSHASLKSMLRSYANPNDKIHRLIADKQLILLKKGLYFFSSDLVGKSPSSILIANHLIGPSYISLEYALSYYQAIPERVYIVTSICSKQKKTIDTPIGRFTYSKIPKPYYSLGLKQIPCDNGLFGIIASPEKALIDTIITTKGLIFRSMKDVSNFLVEDMRIDEDWLRKLNISLIQQLLELAPKKNSLQFLLKYIAQL